MIINDVALVGQPAEGEEWLTGLNWLNYCSISEGHHRIEFIQCTHTCKQNKMDQKNMSVMKKMGQGWRR